MEFEAVGGIAVGDLTFKIGGQVDNMDGAKRTFLRADTAANTKSL
jgi:hypothetical protein